MEELSSQLKGTTSLLKSNICSSEVSKVVLRCRHQRLDEQD